jgi:hypothetical protein
MMQAPGRQFARVLATQAPRALVVYAWDGKGEPLAPVVRDEAPEFDLVIFDYSGSAGTDRAETVLSCRTECKGEIFREVHAWLQAGAADYDYVGLLDDDIETCWSDVNRLLRIARAHDLDVFAAALSHDSHYCHRQFLHKPGQDVRPVHWVEVMMPFYRRDLFMAAGSYYARTISSYGIDQFVMATLQKLLGFERVAVIDAVVMRHGRPITSDDKTFANGLTAHQERRQARRRAMAQVASERPDLLGSAWYLKTFAPWDGPVRFLWLRLALPWLRLRSRRAPARIGRVSPA